MNQSTTIDTKATTNPNKNKTTNKKKKEKKTIQWGSLTSSTTTSNAQQSKASNADPIVSYASLVGGVNPTAASSSKSPPLKTASNKKKPAVNKEASHNKIANSNNVLNRGTERKEQVKQVPSSSKSNKSLVVHCKRGEYDVYIGRRNPSIPENKTLNFKWGNPFKIGPDGNREDVIRKYDQWIQSRPDLMELARVELKGKVLACWCSPEACHGDVLARIANS